MLELTGFVLFLYGAECGNYLEQNLSEAKYYVRRYLHELKENKRYDYPTATD